MGRSRQFFAEATREGSLGEAIRRNELVNQRAQGGEGFPIHRGEVRTEPDMGVVTRVGSHWSTSADMGVRFGVEHGEMEPGRTHVVWHGVLEDREHQEEPNEYRRDGTATESEITLAHNAPVRITGYSYRTPQEGESGYASYNPDNWTHVDLPTTATGQEGRYLHVEQMPGTGDQHAYERARALLGTRKFLKMPSPVKGIIAKSQRMLNLTKMMTDARVSDAEEPVSGTRMHIDYDEHGEPESGDRLPMPAEGWQGDYKGVRWPD